MGLNKKSVFYTMSAIALIIVIIITHVGQSTFSETDRMNAIEYRIETVNLFIKDVEKDLNKGAFIAGFRTILSFNEYITTNGTYLDDVEERFKESFINGTIYGQPLTLMNNATFTDWAYRISQQADKIDIDFNFILNDVKLEQIDPWRIGINLNLTLNIRDKTNLSSWNRERNLVTGISIVGFEDPLYIINSQGKITNLITVTNISQFVIDGEPSNLMLHTNDSFYIVRNGSPSFLMRFEGNLSSSPNGIESLVNVEEFLDQGIASKDRSIVDYIYFGTESTTDNRINMTPAWLKLDDSHLSIYGAENITCLPAACSLP